MLHPDCPMDYHHFGRKYPNGVYERTFINWFQQIIPSDNTESEDLANEPGNSWCNGSAMHVSPAGWAMNTRNDVLQEPKRSSEVTHNHPEGIMGAQAAALGVFLARSGHTKGQIRLGIQNTFEYDLQQRLVDLCPNYTFDVSRQGSVPEAILSFLESKNMEGAIRLATGLGGDVETQACIGGGIAETNYGPLSTEMTIEIHKRLPDDFFACNR